MLYRRRSLETTLKIRLIRCPYVRGFISGLSIFVVVVVVVFNFILFLNFT